jgi:hypothetical protein
VRDASRNLRPKLHRKKRRDNQAVRLRRVSGYESMMEGWIGAYFQGHKTQRS